MIATTKQNGLERGSTVDPDTSMATAKSYDTIGYDTSSSRLARAASRTVRRRPSRKADCTPIPNHDADCQVLVGGSRSIRALESLISASHQVLLVVVFFLKILCTVILCILSSSGSLSLSLIWSRHIRKNWITTKNFY